MTTTLYCGTYEEGGIYKVDFTAGRFGKAELFCAIDSPKYLCEGDGFLLTLCQKEGRGGLAVVDGEGRIKASLGYEDKVPCHVMYHEGIIGTANFHEGTFCRLKYENNEITLIRKLKIRDKAGCHMLLPWQDKLLGFALYMDRIYVLNSDLECVNEIAFPQGSGPRHGVFSADGNYLYVVSELSNQLFILKTETWEILDTLQLCDMPGATSAAIRLYNDRLYVSVRGWEKVCVADVVNEKLVLSDVYDCGGRHPRDMIVVDGYAICANRFTSSLTSVRDGMITDSVTIPEAVSVIEMHQ